MNRIRLILILVEVRDLIADKREFRLRDNLVRFAIHAVMVTITKDVEGIRRQNQIR